MILGSELEKYSVYDSLGKEIGTIKDIIVDTTKEEWNTKEIILNKGILKGESVFSYEDINKLDEETKRVELKEQTKLHELDENKYSHEYLSMDSVKKREILSSEEDEVGKIYDYVILNSLERWKISKILVKPHEHILTGRRIRLDVKNIDKIKEMITLKLAKKELIETSEEE
jgi:sporulation protein YlmC with PRC-barrel domain